MGRGKKRRPGKGGGGRGRGPSQSRNGNDRPLPGLGAFQVTRTEAGPGRLADEDFQVRDVAPGQATKLGMTRAGDDARRGDSAKKMPPHTTGHLPEKCYSGLAFPGVR